MHHYSGGIACFEHSNFFKVKSPAHPDTQLRGPGRNRLGGQDNQSQPRGGPEAWTRDPTTSFLTATTLIYASGAGITAAAGTRLALQ